MVMMIMTTMIIMTMIIMVIMSMILLSGDERSLQPSDSFHCWLHTGWLWPIGWLLEVMIDLIVLNLICGYQFGFFCVGCYISPIDCGMHTHTLTLTNWSSAWGRNKMILTLLAWIDWVDWVVNILNLLLIIPSEMEVAPHPQNCWYHTEHKTI